MAKQNFLTLTLIISGLALQPVLAESEYNRVSQSQTINQSVAGSISSILHNRGLDEDVADVLATNLVDEEDEILLSMFIHDLEMQNIVSKDEVLTYLSTAALHKQKLNFHTYDALVGMVSKISQKSLDQNTLSQLRHMAKQNVFMFA